MFRDLQDNFFIEDIIELMGDFYFSYHQFKYNFWFLFNNGYLLQKLYDSQKIFKIKTIKFRSELK